MAFFVTNIAPQQLTGLTIVRANEIWLTNPLTDVTQEISGIFVPFANISTVYEQTHNIGQGRSYTTIEWNEPIDDRHVPGLESLLRYLRNFLRAF
jgi:hypothetical protein